MDIIPAELSEAIADVDVQTGAYLALCSSLGLEVVQNRPPASAAAISYLMNGCDLSRIEELAQGCVDDRVHRIVMSLVRLRQGQDVALGPMEYPMVLGRLTMVLGRIGQSEWINHLVYCQQGCSQDGGHGDYALTISKLVEAGELDLDYGADAALMVIALRRSRDETAL